MSSKKKNLPKRRPINCLDRIDASKRRPTKKVVPAAEEPSSDDPQNRISTASMPLSCKKKVNHFLKTQKPRQPSRLAVSVRPDFFLLVDLRDFFFFRFRVGGTK